MALLVEHQKLREAPNAEAQTPHHALTGTDKPISPIQNLSGWTESSFLPHRPSVTILVMTVYETLRQAILAKKGCRIAKPGEPERKVCPYRLGKSGAGEQNVIYYQYDGYTSRAGGLQPDGSTENWRCNHVADIESASIIDEPWHEPTVKPKTRGKCVVEQDVEVNYYN